MKPFSVLVVIFLVVPTVEIYLLIKIGYQIGAIWTVSCVVATAVIGAWLLKYQGIYTINKAIGSVKAGTPPALELVEGLFLLLAGALLITPGFVTDTIGFICLTPHLRAHLAAIVLRKLTAHVHAEYKVKSPEIYNGEYYEIKDSKKLH